MENFYAFSGLDGAGKSTQIDLLKKYLQDNNKTIEVIWSRGGYTPIFQGLKDLVRKSSSNSLLKPGRSETRTQNFKNPITRKIWLTIAIIDLFFLYGIYFRWCNLQGKAIIADRYVEDTIIDFKLNFPEEKVEKWILWRIMYCLIPFPKKHFMLLISVEESMKRSILKNEPFPDDEATLHARLNNYNNFLKQNAHFVYVDCMNPIEKVSEAILKNVTL